MVVEVLFMRLTISKSKSTEHLYISKSYRNNNGKSTSRIFKKLGTMQELLPKHGNDRERVLAWAKEEARICTEEEKKEKLEISLSLSETKQLSMNEQVTFSGGYLFLQHIFYELGLGKICKQISRKHSFKYDLSSVLSKLIYARILSPSSKLSSFEYMHQMIEQPDFGLHDIYRALDVLNKEANMIQSSLYKNGEANRDSSILYYDCTNFFFEIENEDGFRNYGKSKEHRPNPIVQMGLFLDANGIPLAFTVFPGNENEQPTLIPMEKQIMKDFSLSKFIICTDAGLASQANRRFNNHKDRSFIVTQSLKKLKGHLKEWALDPKGWMLGQNKKLYDISKIDEEKYSECIFHKERWICENGFEQRLIVSFSPKYKCYQREIRKRQIDRAIRIIQKGASAKTQNPNSPLRFVDEMQLTIDGEIASVKQNSLDIEKISEEERYDGFTAVCTTLEDDIEDILKINHRRWEIEESFRIMKSEFKARPVFLRKEERIKAHFLICFLSLLVYRTFEKKVNEKYTISELTSTLKGFDFYRVKGLGYVPLYKRNEITDVIHEAFGFRTDKDIVPDKKMKKFIRDSKSY